MRNNRKRQNKPRGKEWDFLGMCRHEPEHDDIRIVYDEIKHETGSAVLFDIGGDEHWMPKSQISEVDKDEVWITKWLAGKIDLG